MSMLLAETEAQLKFCPLKSDYIGEPQCRCVASHCMAWRWGAPLIERSDIEKSAADGWKPATYFDHARGAEARRWERETAKRGYCGLAGKVEGV